MYLIWVIVGLWQDVCHVRRFGDVLVVAENVNGVFARGYRIVANVGGTVAIVIAFDLGLRRTFNTESCAATNNNV